MGGVSTARQMVQIWITKGANHGSYRSFVIIELQKKSHMSLFVYCQDRPLDRIFRKAGNSVLLLSFVQYSVG